jgi:hypothetical protein
MKTSTSKAPPATGTPFAPRTHLLLLVENRNFVQFPDGD